MPWKDISETMLREEFVKKATKDYANITALCNEYGISRTTGYKWINRFKNGESLDNKSRKPFKTVNKTPDEIEKLILDYRREHPAIGALKIKKILENKGYLNIPCHSTINDILKRNNCITKEASLAATPYKRFQKSNPNDMWQADFKGHFPLENNIRCHPLNVIDDCSRMNLCSKALIGEKFEYVYPVFIELFIEFGLPFSLLCDNGNPWGTAQSTGYTKFEVWLMDLGVLTIHCRPKHPQTQGKDERFNQSMNKELLKFKTFSNMETAQQAFDEYRYFYNNERPHHALGLDVPIQHYHRSNKEYSDKIDEWIYSEEYTTRKVKSSGYISINNQGYFLSEAFGDRTIAFKESENKNCVKLFYRNFIIGEIDLEGRVFKYKKAYLIDNDPRKTDNN